MSDDTKQILEEIFYKHDFQALARIGAPPDEYSPEAERVAEKLADCKSVEEVGDLTHLVYAKMFAPLIMKRTQFDSVAKELWNHPELFSHTKDI